MIFVPIILFSTQNQLPHIIIGMGRVIYLIKAFSVVILTTLKNFEQIISVSRKNQSNIFDCWFNCKLIKWVCSFSIDDLCLIKAVKS